jgi:hypothetical protein
MSHRSLLVVALAWCLVPQSAQAQEPGLAGLLLRFFSPQNPVVLRQAPEPLNHAAHFVSQPEAQALLRQLNQGIATQLATFPLGSSSPGFTYTFDPALGVYERSTESFGPVFSERPLTAGKGKFSFGLSFRESRYDRFEGRDLRADDLPLYLTHQDINLDGSELNPWFEGDLIRADLALTLDSQTTVLVANYGLSERLDIGLALPFQKVDLAARIRTKIERLSTGSDPFVVHAFDDGTDGRDFLESGSASGIGDVVLRGKWNFLRRADTSLALAADLRLPTGDEGNLLGSGATQTKLYLVVAGPARRLAPRASVGYTFSRGGSEFSGDLPDEIGYSAGFDAALHKRVTLTADFIGRRLRDTGRLVQREKTFQYVLRGSSQVLQTTRVTSAPERGDLDLMLGAAALKINPVGRLLVSLSVLFSVGNSGLQDKLAPVIGLDYSF